jgi:hypothetical protein
MRILFEMSLLTIVEKTIQMNSTMLMACSQIGNRPAIVRGESGRYFAVMIEPSVERVQRY